MSKPDPEVLANALSMRLMALEQTFRFLEASDCRVDSFDKLTELNSTMEDYLFKEIKEHNVVGEEGSSSSSSKVGDVIKLVPKET